MIYAITVPCVVKGEGRLNCAHRNSNQMGGDAYYTNT